MNIAKCRGPRIEHRIVKFSLVSFICNTGYELLGNGRQDNYKISPGQVRTYDLRNSSQMLYPLSY